VTIRPEGIQEIGQRFYPTGGATLDYPEMGESPAKDSQKSRGWVEGPALIRE